MKKLACILSLLFIFSFTSVAQEQYVEVIVKDTLYVEPQRWIMLVNIEKQYDYATMSDTTGVMSTSDSVTTTLMPASPKLKKGTSPDEVKALAKKMKGSIVNDSIGTFYSSAIYSNYGSRDEHYFSVEFTNRKAMEDFSKAVQKYNDVRVSITSAVHSDLQRFQGLLETKLVNTAKQKASRLAQLGGRKAGAVILISEATASESNSLMDLIETLIKYEGSEARRMALLNLFPDKIKLEKSLKIRFALE